MRTVHALVAEVARELIYSVEAAYDEAFQIKLVGDTQVHRDVERIVVRDERTCRGAARNRLKHRRLHLKIAVFVEEATYAVDGFCPLYENILNFVIYNEIDVAHTITQLRVVELVVFHTVFFLDNRQRTQTLAEHRHLLDVNGNLAHLGAESKTFYADEVADVEKTFENDIVHSFVLARTNLVAVEIKLYAAVCVLQLAERGGSHDAAAHDTSTNAHVFKFLEVVIVKLLLNLRRCHVHVKRRLRIRIDSQFIKLLQ